MYAATLTREALMSLSVTFTAPGRVELVEEEDRPLQAGEIRVRTLFSGISAGTEMSAYRGTNPYLNKRWDAERRLFVADPSGTSIAYPVIGWGYEEVGEVCDVGPGVSGPAEGTLIFGSWGHRSTAVLDAAYAAGRILPAGLDPILGIFSHIGATALNGVLDAAIRLGETAAVFGLGVVGQIVAQMARLSGAEVIGVDMLPERLAMARTLGAVQVLPAAENPAERIKDITGRRGADVCIEASGSYRALHEAIRACAYTSRVVALGFYQGEGAGLALGEEMHHNRISLVTSQIGGLASELQHRWDRERLVHTVMRLAADEKLQLHPLITQIRPAGEAADLFRLIDEHPDRVLQAVLDFRSI
jgi:threonine dehydrogenase-like Zn-dependent dehydrogenase